MDYEQIINRQIADKLLDYNYDLKKKKGEHHLQYFSWFGIGCLAIYIIIQIIRAKV